MTRHECGNCTRLFPVLVDDSGLCITCDALLFPTPPEWPTPAPVEVRRPEHRLRSWRAVRRRRVARARHDKRMRAA